MNNSINAVCAIGFASAVAMIVLAIVFASHPAMVGFVLLVLAMDSFSAANIVIGRYNRNCQEAATEGLYTI